MKIALVSPYDFAYPGGVANHISSLYKYLTNMGHEVKVIAPASKAVTTFGDDFTTIGKPRPIPTSGSVIRISLSVRLASTIKEVLDREKFDIVHLHEPFMPMLCSAVLRFSNTVNIGTFHASDGTPGYNFAWPLGRMMVKRRTYKLDGKIAVSKSAMRYASKYVSGDFTIIPNGIDLEHFSPDVPPLPQFNDGRPNILFLGRLEKRKGLDYLFRAYRQVKQEMPEVRLLIVGPGTRLRKRFERWVRQHKMKDVIFTGAATYADLPRYYKTADIFCSPATGRESFGIVLVEAMSMGKPVVATTIEGYASVVTHGEEGLLVPPKDSGKLAQALLILLKDKALQQRMGEKGKLTARNYSWEKIARSVFDFYLKAMSTSPRRKTVNN
jgi:phosphatidylinositol alpha-mannosyltransferase